MQILDIGTNDGRLLLVRHIEQVVTIRLEEGIRIILLLLGRFTHDQRLDTLGRGRFGGIDVHRKEEVALGLVGNIGALLQILDLGRSQRLIRRARIDHLYTGHPLLDLLTQAQDHLQGQILLLYTAIDRSRIVTAVAGIEHHDTDAVLRLRLGRGSE